MSQKKFVLGPDPFGFGDWTVHPIDGVLSRNGESARVEPRVMQVLVYLAERTGELVSKGELLNSAWARRFVEEAVLSQSIYTLRKSLGDDARSPRYIETLPRRGYRAIADVRPSTVTRDLPEVPSVVVLPFEDFSERGEDRFLSSGITTELITKLTKLRDLFVIGASSSMRYKEHAAEVETLSEQLGVRYVLKGTVQRAEHRVKAHAQLVDSVSNQQLWGESFDRIVEDVFSIQEEIAEAIVTELSVHLTEGEQARLWRRSTTDYSAYEEYLRGLEALYEATPEGSQRAVELFNRAVEIDPEFGQAWAMKGMALSIGSRYGWVNDVQAALREMKRAADRAIELDESLPAGHTVIGFVLLSEGELKRAIEKLRRACELGPGSSFEHAVLANLLAYGGQGAEALSEIRRAIRLSPFHPHWYLLILGDAHRALGQHEAAIEAYEANLVRSPEYLLPRPRLISSLVQLGKTDEARREAQRLAEIHPGFRPEDLTGEWGKRAIAYRDPAERERLRGDVSSVWPDGGEPAAAE